MSTCGGCGGEISEFMERETRRLLSERSLGTARTSLLREAYHGDHPEVLCGNCFSPTVSMLNNAPPSSGPGM